MAYSQKGEKEFWNCNTATLQRIMSRNVKNYPAQKSENVQNKGLGERKNDLYNCLVISALQRHCF